MKGGVAPMGVAGIETSSLSPPDSSIVPEGACNLKLLSESSDESSSSLDFLRPQNTSLFTRFSSFYFAIITASSTVIEYDICVESNCNDSMNFCYAFPGATNVQAQRPGLLLILYGFICFCRGDHVSLDTCGGLASMERKHGRPCARRRGHIMT